MSRPVNKVPVPPKRQNEDTDSESTRTVNVRAPPSVTGDAPLNGTTEKAKEDDKKKPGFMAWKDKVAAKGAEMAANAKAGAATLNAAVVASGEKMRNRLLEDSSDDDGEVESSDEETDDLFNDTLTGSTISTTPTATAIAIRNQPAVNFINVAEEERIKAELKDARNLRKKLRKFKKFTEKSVKSIRSFSEVNENVIASLHTATDDKCTDPTIIALAAAAERRIQEVKQSNAYSNFNTNITDQILEQIKPINDHAKMISVTGKERRVARDRRIRLALGQVDVTNEEEYNKSADLVRDFEEKDRTYKDEFVNFREHNSSQLGQMLRCYLLETATYLETVAKALRESAGGTANNYYLSNDCCTKYKDFNVDSKFLSPIPALFSNIIPDENNDRLTAKPQPQPHPPSGKQHQAPAVAGIPIAETKDEAAEQNAYGSSTYTRSMDNTRVRRGINNFLLTGQLPASDASRMSPQPLPGRRPNVETPQGKLNGPLLASENPRARPTSVVNTSSTTKSLMDYIHSLADEYGIEPDFALKSEAERAKSEGPKSESNNSDNINYDEYSYVSRPPSVVSRAKSATPYSSIILPPLHGSGRITAPTCSPAALADEYPC
jgi:hypothetical protein